MNQTTQYIPALAHPWKPFIPSDQKTHATKMGKQLARIAALCAGGYSQHVISPRKEEVREEVKLAKTHDDDESILDVEVEVQIISPELARAVAPAKRLSHAKQDDGYLNDIEREMLARDLLAYRIAEDVRLAQVHTPYALIPYQATA